MEDKIKIHITTKVYNTLLKDCEDRNIKEWAYLKNNIKENLKEYG